MVDRFSKESHCGIARSGRVHGNSGWGDRRQIVYRAEKLLLT
jgi:hypothetical protein